MFIAAFFFFFLQFPRYGNNHQHMNGETNEKKKWYTYTHTHSGILLGHKKEILPLAARWIDLEEKMLSEISQTEKEKKTRNITYTWNHKKKKKQENQFARDEGLRGRGNRKGWFPISKQNKFFSETNSCHSESLFQTHKKADFLDFQKNH